MFCATSVLGMSRQRLNHSTSCVLSYGNSIQVKFFGKKAMILIILKILILKVHIGVFLMVMLLMQMEYGCMVICIIQPYMVFFIMIRLQKGLHQKT